MTKLRLVSIDVKFKGFPIFILPQPINKHLGGIFNSSDQAMDTIEESIQTWIEKTTSRYNLFTKGKLDLEVHLEFQNIRGE